MMKCVLVLLSVLLCGGQARGLDLPLLYQAPISLPAADAPHGLRVQAFHLARVSRVNDGKIYLGSQKMMSPKEAARFYSNMGATEAAVVARKDLKGPNGHHHSGYWGGWGPECHDPNCARGLGEGLGSGCGNANVSGGEAAGAVLIVALVAVIAVVVIVAVVKAVAENRDANLPQASIDAALEYNRWLLARLNLPELSARLD